MWRTIVSRGVTRHLSAPGERSMWGSISGGSGSTAAALFCTFLPSDHTAPIFQYVQYKLYKMSRRVKWLSSSYGTSWSDRGWPLMSRCHLHTMAPDQSIRISLPCSHWESQSSCDPPSCELRVVTAVWTLHALRPAFLQLVGCLLNTFPCIMALVCHKPRGRQGSVAKSDIFY